MMYKKWCKFINIPKDIESVSRIDHTSESLKGADLDENYIESVWQSVIDLYLTGAHPAIAICLRRNGVMVMNRSIGHARGNGPRDTGDTEKVIMTPDTPVCLFSASKAITAMLVHKLAEDKIIELDKPVADYIPEFGAFGKQYITVGHVLSHRAGVPKIKQRRTDPSLLYDWDAVIAKLCNTRPRKDAMAKQAYHAITGGFILGEVIRRATGQDLRDVLTEQFRLPLEVRYLNYGLEPGQADDAAINYTTGFTDFYPATTFARKILGVPFSQVTDISNTQEFKRAVIPAGNIYATADEANRFFQCLLQSGTWKGKRVIRRSTIARAIREASPRHFDKTLLAPIRTSEGMMLGDKPFGLYGPDTAQAFGHLGFINIFCWADPQRNLSASILTTGKPLITRHIIPLVRLMRTINHIPDNEAI